MSLISLLSLVLLFSIPTDDDKDPQEADSRSLNAAPIQEGIVLDGFLNDADWARASVATDFLQFEPEEGSPSAEQTEVRVLYGPNAIYIGVRMYDEEPGAIMKTLGRRDDFSQADWFFVGIDSYYNRKSAYIFGINAAGIQLDGIEVDGTTFSPDPRELDTSWDAVWFSATQIDGEGWTAEMRIPYSMLRFPEADVQQWGINFRRVIARKSEISEWRLVRRENYSSGAVAQYGTLEGLVNLRPRRNIQFMPYTVSQLNSTEGDPGIAVRTRDFNFGGDLKFGISSNITLDATINPDFGQVESDPAILNLTAFEAILEERRPFFVEGVQIFDFRFGFRDALLYTRRIGANAPIIGASKISGRTDKGLSFGLLGALTGQQFDPSRFYGVARAIQQIGDYSNVGAIFTAFDNSQRDEDLPYGRRAFAGGLNWDFRLKNNRYRIDGQASFTNRLEPGSGLDGESGISFSLGADRTRGIWTYGSEISVMSDLFNPNDLGRLRQNDQFRLSAFVAHLINKGKPFGPFQRGSLRLFHWEEWNYDRSLYTGAGFFFATSWLTKRFNPIEMRIVSREPWGGYDQFDTRGLIPRRNPHTLDFEGSMLSDSRRTWQLGPVVQGEFQSTGGGQVSSGIEGSWNIGSRLTLGTEALLGFENNTLAWASNEVFRAAESGGWEIGNEGRTEPLEQPGFTAFSDGDELNEILNEVATYESTSDYYVPVYGRRDNRSLDLTVRSNITFTKDLSLQLFSQLFVARGAYKDFSILQNPETNAAFSNYPKQHDFSINSFITNVVLRWEFQPGSSLFLVWSQSRYTNEDVDPFNPHNLQFYDNSTRNQIQDTFGLFPDNVFLIKLNYLFRS